MSFRYDIQKDEDDDDEIEAYQFADEPAPDDDDGLYAPSNGVLGLMCVLILIVAAGVGVGAYFAYEEWSGDDSPNVSSPTPPTPNPTVAPVNPPPTTSAPIAPTEQPIAPTPAPVELFICPICPDDLAITKFDGIVSIEGRPDRSCTALLSEAEMGNINDIECGLIQSQSLGACECRGERTEDSVLQLLAAVIGPDVIAEGTVYSQAANWLLNEDPRFEPLSGRRLQADDNITDDTNGSNDGNGSIDGDSDGVTDGDGTSDGDSAMDGDSALDGDSDGVADSNSTSVYDGANDGDGDIDGEELFVCPICGEGNEATDLAGLVSIEGVETACQLLATTAEFGQIDETECAELQLLTSVPCGCAPIESMTGDDTFTLSDISDGELIQRYLLVLFYYQTTSSRATAWASDCAAVDNMAAANTTCNYVTPARLENGALAPGASPKVEPASRWLSESSECDWAGVTCVDGEVDSIFLVQFGLLGTLPTEILMIPSLRWLDFAYNRFTGSVPSEYLASLQNFEVNHNNLTGNGFGGEALWANSTIESLNVAANQLTGTLPTNTNNNLQRLFAYSNQLLGTIPTYYLAGQIDLFQLDLSDNSFVGSVPPILLPDSTKGITDLDLSKNQLQGDLTVDSAKLESLRLDDNRFLGSIPDGILEARGLVDLSLGGNRFDGQIPAFEGPLQSLDLSGNFLSGTIPSTLGSLFFLESLDLSNNNLEGTLPPELFLLTNLESLELSINAFRGTISSGFGQLTNLEQLEIDQNFFIGIIPTQMLRLTDLSVFTFNKNSLRGSLPVEFCDVLYEFEVLRGDCGEISCDCCTECCTDQGTCETAVGVLVV